MLGIIKLVLWVIFIFNLLALIGRLSIGKFLFDSDILFLRILMDPDRTSKSVLEQADRTLRTAGNVAIFGAILFLIYF